MPRAMRYAIHVPVVGRCLCKLKGCLEVLLLYAQMYHIKQRQKTNTDVNRHWELDLKTQQFGALVTRLGKCVYVTGKTNVISLTSAYKKSRFMPYKEKRVRELFPQPVQSEMDVGVAPVDRSGCSCSGRLRRVPSSAAGRAPRLCGGRREHRGSLQIAHTRSGAAADPV
eukprot:1195500-Prorocentrum_minimum.AAC.7